MLAPADRWQPPHALYEHGRAVRDRGTVPYVGGSLLTSDDRSQIQRTPGPGLEALARYVREQLDLPSVGTRRGTALVRAARGLDGQLRRRDVHEEGRALDAMMPRGGAGPEARAAGTALAEWLVRHAEPLGVQYVLWRGVEWGSGRAPAWEVYSGTDPHTSHVHAELTPATAASALAVNRALVDLALAGTPLRIPTAGALGLAESIPAPVKALGLAGVLAALVWLAGRSRSRVRSSRA